MSLSRDSSFPLLPARVVESCPHAHIPIECLLMLCSCSVRYQECQERESGSYMPDMHIFCWNTKCSRLALSWPPQASGSWVLLHLFPSCSTVSLLETDTGIPWCFLPCSDSNLVNNICWEICLVWFFFFHCKKEKVKLNWLTLWSGPALSKNIPFVSHHWWSMHSTACFSGMRGGEVSGSLDAKGRTGFHLVIIWQSYVTSFSFLPTPLNCSRKKKSEEEKQILDFIWLENILMREGSIKCFLWWIVMEGAGPMPSLLRPWKHQWDFFAILPLCL